jgi:hypothetical protein
LLGPFAAAKAYLKAQRPVINAGVLLSGSLTVMTEDGGRPANHDVDA